MARSSKSSGIIASQTTTLAQELKLQELRQANANLARNLQREREKKEDLVSAIHSAIDTAAAGLIIPRVPRPPIRFGNHGKEEVALISVSDLQLAKVTPTYNTEICERRMETYAEAINRIVNIQRSDHPVRDARIYLIGDIIEGELIFPHQSYQIDAGLFTQLMVDAPRILVNFVRSLLTTFRHIHVVAVEGNHGALGGPVRKQYNPETNADKMVYRYMSALMANEPRVSWQIAHRANEVAWYAVDYPFAPKRDHGVMIFHGHQIPNVGSASTGTIARRIWGYASGAIPEPFENVIFGHWHTPKYIPMNRVHVFCNGSVESTNIYAQERLSAIGQPVQLLAFMHPNRGVTAQYWVTLEKNPIFVEQGYDLPPPKAYAPVPMPEAFKEEK